MDLVTTFRSARRDPDVVVLEGFHACKHALRFGASPTRLVSPDPDTVLGLAGELAPDILERLETLIEPITAAVYEELAPRAHPTRLIGIAHRPPGADPLAAPGRVVVLERPRRPNNVGAAVRVAAAAGAGGLLVIDGTDPWGPEAVRTGAGLQFALAVGEAESLADSGRPVVVFDAEGDPSPLLPDDAVVCFGSERSGVSRELRDRADLVRAIPMRPGVSSLNLATAVAAALYRAGS
ncbi:MAG TPA: TrmH family RNA methyltransferase [Acidimicrobiia bacterium]|nr:TrmH family RNA methyltransferase [Acidimicrobiia bacterium]